MIADRALRDLTFMMRKEQVHSTAMNVELPAKILGAHGRALDVPAGETLAPGAFPPHDVFR